MKRRDTNSVTGAAPVESSAKRLLLLDDEEALLVPIAHYFGDLGYDVVTASEPEEAEALIENEPFDLVILDLALTRFGREGLEVFRSIRAGNPWLPVIIFSANVCPEVEEEAYALGVDAVLPKPQKLPDLARVVARLLGQTQ